MYDKTVDTWRLFSPVVERVRYESHLFRFYALPLSRMGVESEQAPTTRNFTPFVALHLPVISHVVISMNWFLELLLKLVNRISIANDRRHILNLDLGPQLRDEMESPANI